MCLLTKARLLTSLAFLIRLHVHSPERQSNLGQTLSYCGIDCQYTMYNLHRSRTPPLRCHGIVTGYLYITSAPTHIPEVRYTCIITQCPWTSIRVWFKTVGENNGKVDVGPNFMSHSFNPSPSPSCTFLHR